MITQLLSTTSTFRDHTFHRGQGWGTVHSKKIRWPSKEWHNKQSSPKTYTSIARHGLLDKHGGWGKIRDALSEGPPGSAPAPGPSMDCSAKVPIRRSGSTAASSSFGPSELLTEKETLIKASQSRKKVSRRKDDPYPHVVTMADRHIHLDCPCGSKMLGGDAPFS